MDNIVWQRWAVYFVFGTPFLAWLFFTKNNVLRLIAVVAVEVIVQNSFAARRYLWAIGVGPANITAYVALMGALVGGRRMPRFGPGVWTGWALFLFFAFSGLLIGAISRGNLIFNVVNFQELYVEGFLFFLLGALALSTYDEVDRFVYWFAMLGVVVASAHLFCLATGYHFRDFDPLRVDTRDVLYGALFNNSNTQGAFYAMAIPMSLALVTGGKLPRTLRVPVLAAIVLMGGSLILSWHRAGFITTVLMSMVVLFGGRLGARRSLALLFVGLAGAVVAVILVQSFFPEAFERILETKGAKGLKTERVQIFVEYLPVLAENPFGVGLYGQDVLQVARKKGIEFVPHNVYLSMAVALGVPGLLVFLGMIGSVVHRNYRAWTSTRDLRARQVLTYLFLAVNAFLVVGITEPVYENGEKLNHIFWMFCGMSLAFSARVLGEVRARRSAALAAGPLEEMPAPGV